MNVRSLMVRSIHTCRPEDPLTAAAKIMWENDCGSVPVVDGSGRVIGMITDRDICMAAYTRDMLLSAMTVSSVSANGVVAVHETDSIESAERQMREHQIRRLPVTDEGGRPIGMLSLNDLARGVRRSGRGGDLEAEAIVATLAAIGTPRSRPIAH